jgi:hypothetical protein
MEIIPRVNALLSHKPLMIYHPTRPGIPVRNSQLSSIVA